MDSDQLRFKSSVLCPLKQRVGSEIVSSRASLFKRGRQLSAVRREGCCVHLASTGVAVV